MEMSYWKEYHCPSCSRCLTPADLAEIHYTNNCPACNTELSIDAKGALSQTKSASILAVLLTAIFICVDGALLRFVGIADEAFKTWSQTLLLTLTLGVIFVGIFSIVVTQLIINHILLKIAFNKLKKQGTL